MGDRADDPVDHQRTTLKHAGQDWKNTRAMPGLIAVGVSSAVVFIALFGFATANHGVGITAAVVAVVLLVGGLVWLRMERNRVRRVEVEYLNNHPEADAQPPSS